MPVGYAAAAAAVGAIGSAAMSADAAHDAARTQRAGAADASAVQREALQTMTRQQTPFMQSGYGANAELSRLLGITPQTAMGTPVGAGGSGAGMPIGDLIHSQGGVPVKNAELYANNPAYRSAWDRALQWEQQNSPGWNGQSTYFARATDADMARLGDRIQQYMGEERPTSGGVTAGPGGSIERRLQPGDASLTGAAGGGSGGSGGTGLPAGYLTQTFGPQQFMAGMDPGYQWRMQQGAQGVMNTAAAASGSLSGPALKALMEYNQGGASQEFGAAFDRFQTQQGNIFQRLSAIAGMGQNAAAGVGQQGVATAGNIGSNIVGAANAGAAGQIGAANAWGGALSDLGALGYMYATRPKTGTGG